MKIAVVSNALPPSGTGGAELYARDIADALTERHDVLVLSGTPEPDTRASAATLPRLRDLRENENVVAKAAWHLRDQWRPSVSRAMRRAFSTFEPDVVFTHEPQGLSASIFGRSAAGGQRHVHMTHDLNLLCVRTSMTVDGVSCDRKCAPCALQRSIRLRALRSGVDMIIAPSDSVRTRHVNAGLDPASIVTIRHGARAPSVASSSSSGLTVGFLGTLAAHKGIYTLLRAFEHGDPLWRLVIAGAGPAESTVRAAALADERIDYRGFVAGLQKEQFFADIDVLVVPSECEEVAPLVVSEAVVRLKPLIASDRGGLTELPAAETFRAGDSRELRAALAQMLHFPARLERERSALADLVEEFGWERHVERVESVLAGVAGR